MVIYIFWHQAIPNKHSAKFCIFFHSETVSIGQALSQKLFTRSLASNDDIYYVIEHMFFLILPCPFCYRIIDKDIFCIKVLVVKPYKIQSFKTMFEWLKIIKNFVLCFPFILNLGHLLLMHINMFLIIFLFCQWRVHTSSNVFQF